MLNNLHSTINLAEYQHPGYFNMPDMLSVGQGQQSQAQYRAQMLLWSVMGAPLILGADIRKLDAFTKSLVTAAEVLAVNSDPDCVQVCIKIPNISDFCPVQGSFLGPLLPMLCR